MDEEHIRQVIECFTFLCARTFKGEWTDEDGKIAARLAHKIARAGNRSTHGKHWIVAIWCLMNDCLEGVKELQSELEKQDISGKIGQSGEIGK